MKEIKIIITKQKPIYNENKFVSEIFIDGKWFKEIGGFPDPALLLDEISKNEDLKQFMRPDLNHHNEKGGDSESK